MIHEWTGEPNSKKISAYLSKNLAFGDWLFLDGDLGAGKTTLVQNLLKDLGTQNLVTSPTFSILNVDLISHRLTKSQWKILHLDLYRIKRAQELLYLGIESEFNPENSLLIAEWPNVVDEEGWENFFQITSCLRPKRLFELTIEGAGASRSYVLKSSFSLCQALSSK